MIGRRWLASSLAAVVINEVLPNPAGDGNEWVELFNTSDEAVHLSGWILVDKVGRGETFPEGKIIDPGGFFLYERGEGWLNNSGYETVVLRDASGNTVDSMAYGAGRDPIESVGGTPDVEESIGRVGDGGSSWSIFSQPTKGAPNPIPTPSPGPTPTLEATDDSPDETLLGTPLPTSSPEPPTELPPTSLFSPPAVQHRSPSVLGAVATPSPTPRMRRRGQSSPSASPPPFPTPEGGSQATKAGRPWGVYVLIPALLTAGIGFIGLAMKKSGVVE